MEKFQNQFTKHAGVEFPIICGAMYPCSNPELVAAASEAGGLGIVQPLSLTYVHGYEIREGLKRIRELTQKPIGLNILTEKSIKVYQKRMEHYLEVALEEGIRFFVTALGDPSWVIDKVKPKGGIVYHDVTERKYALKVLPKGVEGLICVNNRAGGHAGKLSVEDLYKDLLDLNVPLICAGGVGNPESFKKALELGYQGIQMGTRFIATKECTAHHDYKEAIIAANEDDIVLTEKVTGVPLAVINTDYIKKVGTKAGVLANFFLKRHYSKHMMRLFYSLISVFKLKRSNFRPMSSKDYWQAGKSVAGIKTVESAGDIVRSFTCSQ